MLSQVSKINLVSDLNLSLRLLLEGIGTQYSCFGRVGVNLFWLVCWFPFSSFASSVPVCWEQCLRSWGNTSSCCSTLSPPSDLMPHSSPRFLAFFCPSYICSRVLIILPSHPSPLSSHTQACALQNKKCCLENSLCVTKNSLNKIFHGSCWKKEDEIT